MQNKGWVRLWREQFSHPISERKPWCDGYAWSYLYSQANFKPGIANFRNQYVPVERGQFVTSVLKLSKIFGWTRKRTKAFLISLQKQEMIDWKSGTNLDQKGTLLGYNRRDNRFSIITIRNYERFQSIEEAGGTTKGTTKGTTGEQQEHTIKECKECKEVKNKTLSVKKMPDARVKEFFDYWGKAFLQETGQPYVFSFGKEGKLVKDLLKVHPLELLEESVNAFFRDERCLHRGLTIGIFFQEINRLISSKAMDPLAQARRDLGMAP